MRSLANMGGLEVASLARSLTMGAMFVKPLEVLGTLTGLRAMGAVLRSRFYTNLIARPTGDVNTIRNLERALGVANGFAVRSLSEATGNVVGEQDKTFSRRVQNIQEGRDLGPRSGAIPIDTSIPPVPPMPTFGQQARTPSLTASGVERERLFRQLAGLESR